MQDFIIFEQEIDLLENIVDLGEGLSVTPLIGYEFWKDVITKRLKDNGFILVGDSFNIIRENKKVLATGKAYRHSPFGSSTKNVVPHVANKKINMFPGDNLSK